jgi:hypothetical protein
MFGLNVTDCVQFLQISLLSFDNFVVDFLKKDVFLLVALKDQGHTISLSILYCKAVFVVKVLLIGHDLPSMTEGYIGQYSFFVFASF